MSPDSDSAAPVSDRSRDVLRGADLLFVDGIVPAKYCEYHPLGGAHPDESGTYRTFGTKHMTIEGARALASDLDADEHRLVHLSHYIPAEEAFDDDMAVDGERFSL